MSGFFIMSNFITISHATAKALLKDASYCFETGTYSKIRLPSCHRYEVHSVEDSLPDVKNLIIIRVSDGFKFKAAIKKIKNVRSGLDKWDFVEKIMYKSNFGWYTKFYSYNGKDVPVTPNQLKYQARKKKKTSSVQTTHTPTNVTVVDPALQNAKNLHDFLKTFASLIKPYL